MTGGGAPRSIAHHGLFVSTGHRTPPRGLATPPRVVCIHGPPHPTTEANYPTTGCLYPQGHPTFYETLNPTGLYISTWNPHLTTRAPQLIPSFVCIHEGKARHHGLCVIDLWTSSDVKRDQTFQSEADIELDMEQYITRHSLVSVTKRLSITSEDRAVPAFIVVTS